MAIGKSVREAITRDLLRHRFAKAIELWYKEHDRLAVDTFDMVIGKDAGLLHAIPDKWLPTKDYIQVKFGAEVTSLYFGGFRYGILQQLVPAKRYTKAMPAYLTHGVVAIYDATHPLARRGEVLENVAGDLLTQISEAQSVLEATLRQAPSVKYLINEWPNASAILSKYAPEKRQLPAIPTERLNTLLELP